MKIKKRVILSITILILAIVVIIVVGVNNMRPEKALNTFLEQIEQGNINNIRLTIYYMNPNILTPFALNIKDLINHPQTQKLIIDGVQLAEHIDLFKKINYVDLIPVDYKYLMDARIHYVFENNRGRKIFDVTFSGFLENDNHCEIIFINGKAFEINDIFNNIIEPFVSEVR